MSYGHDGVTSLPFGVGVFDADASRSLTPGDRVYLNATSPGLLPLYSVRIVGDTGQFGTQVKFGDSDFIATIQTHRAAKVTRVDYGTSGDVADDCFYLHTDVPQNRDAAEVHRYDVRISVGAGCSGKTIGSLVTDSEPNEKGQSNATGGSTQPVRTVYADVNANGRHDLGDCFYLTSGTAGGGALNATSNTAYSIRITHCAGKAPGTLVYSWDPEFQTPGANGVRTTGVPGAPAPAAHVGFFDGDASGGFTPGDRLYLLFNTTALTHGLLPLHSLRLVGDFTCCGPHPTPTTPTTTRPPTTTSPVQTTTVTQTQNVTRTVTDTATSEPDDPLRPTEVPGLSLVGLIAAVAASAIVLAARRR